MRPEELRQAIGFDDLGILPADRSNIASRKEVDTSTKLSRNITIEYPIIVSPMDTISDVEMCIAVNSIGAAAILHRFMPIEEQVGKAKQILNSSGSVYVAVGLQDYQKRIAALSQLAISVFYLDTANGSSILVEEFMRWYNKSYANVHFAYKPDVIIGNTLSKASVYKAINMGASGIRHGIGLGSVCLTSDMTGIQCPSVTALYYGWKAIRGYALESLDKNIEQNLPSLLLDGGIRKPADLVKAIVCGADAVICGGIFAGCKETPGEILYKNVGGRVSYKKFRGMASKDVVEEYNLSDGAAENLFVEGKSIEVPYTGESAVNIIYAYVNGLRSAMSYLGISSISELRGSLWTEKCIGVRL